MLSKKPVATSTPHGRAGSSSVLKEKQLNDSAQPPRKPQREKKTKLIADQKVPTPTKFKENVKQKRSTSSRYVQVNKQEETKRRQHAIDAMKLQESRRQRMCQQTLAEDLEQMALKPITESNNLQIEKKRLEAKQLKEKRILAHLAEQEHHKKALEKAAVSNDRSFPLHRTKNRYTRCLFKPSKEDFIKSLLPKVEEHEELKTFTVKQPTIIQTIDIVMKPQPPRKRSVVRYSKEDIRALNPYGYYFMWNPKANQSVQRHTLFKNLIYTVNCDPIFIAPFVFVLFVNIQIT